MNKGTIVIAVAALSLYIGVWCGIGMAEHDTWFALEMAYVFAIPAILGIIIGYHYGKGDE